MTPPQQDTTSPPQALTSPPATPPVVKQVKPPSPVVKGPIGNNAFFM
jgi:hypothetical protein